MSAKARLGIGALVTAATLVVAPTAHAITADQFNLYFQRQLVGTESAPPQPVWLTGTACGDPHPGNPAGTCIGPPYSEQTDIAVSGPFRIVSNDCPADLRAPGLSAPRCRVEVAFVPTEPGVVQGFLRYSSNGGIKGVPLAGGAYLPPRKCKKGKVRVGKKCKQRKGKKRR